MWKISKLKEVGVLGAVLRASNSYQALDERGFERDLLVTGCGASGTVFVAMLLKSNGISVTHDCGLGRHGVVTNACNGEEVWLYWHKRHGIKEYVQAKIPIQEFRQRLLLVRHPLKVIGSVLEKWRLHGEIWRHVRENMDVGLDLNDPYGLRNGCRYWIQWNSKLEPIVQHTLRLEDVTRTPNILFDLLGKRYWRKHEIESRTAFNPSGTTRYPTWDEIKALDHRLHDELRDKAAHFGYKD